MINYNVKQLLITKTWEDMQDQLSALTGVAIVTVDYKGTPLTKHSGKTAFCAAMRGDDIYGRRCCKCDSLAGLEAARQGKYTIYSCHCGIVEAAVPVAVDNLYLGAVIFGQVRLKEGTESYKKLKHISVDRNYTYEKNNVDKADFRKLYDSLPELQYEQIIKIADLIQTTVNYALNLLPKINQDLAENGNDFYPSLHNKDETSQHKFPDQKPQNEYPYNLQISQYWADVEEKYSSAPIYPALAYIRYHPDKHPRMDEMAYICHLSASYFSRLFKACVGEPYNNYVRRIKLYMARELICTTDKTINQIAFELGFTDDSYLVKLFKASYGDTPLAYRKKFAQK